MRKKHPSLALFVGNFTGFHELIWKSALKAASSLEANLITFTGANLNQDTGEYGRTLNRLFEFARTDALDGILFSGPSTLPGFMEKESFEAFCRSFKPKPTASIGGDFTDIPRTINDNKKGLHDLIVHLAREHERRNIVFVSGPKTNTDAMERVETYRSALRDLGLPCDERSIHYGDFWYPSGEAALKTFFDEHRITPDAIVCANDFMAIGTIHALKRRGIKVPSEIAVTGYDDTPEASAVTPTLTTVRQQVSDQAKCALEMLLAQLDGKIPERSVVIPTQVVFRHSCGCLSANALESKPLKDSGRIPSIASLEENLAKPLANLEVSRAQHPALLRGFLDDLSGKTEDAFLSVFQDCAFASPDINTSFEWHNLLSILGSLLCSCKMDMPQFIKMEHMLDDCRVLVSDLIQGQNAAEHLAESEKRLMLSQAARAIGTSFDLGTVAATLHKGLELLDIRSAYLMTYESGDESHFRLHLAVEDGKDLLKGKEGPIYPAAQLLPPSFWPNGRRFDFIVMPVTFKERFFGIVIFEPGPLDTYVYTDLLYQVSSSTMGANLLQKSRESESQTLSRNARIESLVRPMIDTVMSASTLAAEKTLLLKKISDAASHSGSEIAKTNAVIGNTAGNIESMSECLHIIDEISATINILGLNAAIQAAKSGSSGKAFSVIAKEIRKLAEMAKSNAETITAVLEHLKRSIENTVDSGKESERTFKRLEANIGEVSASLEEISAQMKVLKSSSTEILGVI